MQDLLSKGIIPIEKDLDKHPETLIEGRLWLMGKVAGLIHEVLPAKTIVDNMVSEAIAQLDSAHTCIKARL